MNCIRLAQDLNSQVPEKNGGEKGEIEIYIYTHGKYKFMYIKVYLNTFQGFLRCDVSHNSELVR